MFFFFRFNSVFIRNLYAYSVDPDQMPHFVVSGLGLRCLPRQNSQ